MNFDKNLLRLYAVTDGAWLGEKTMAQAVREALEGGATLVQLREKKYGQGHAFARGYRS